MLFRSANFTLDADSIGEDDVEGVGYCIVGVDNVPVTFGADEIGIIGLSPGEHTLRVDLAGNGGALLQPAVSDLIHVTAI